MESLEEKKRRKKHSSQVFIGECSQDVQSDIAVTMKTPTKGLEVPYRRHKRRMSKSINADSEGQEKKYHKSHSAPVLFKAMKKLHCTYTVKFRIMKLWTGQLYKSSSFGFVTFLACDAQGTRIECQISAQLSSKWKDVLIEGNAYVARKVTISDYGNTPRLVDEPLYMQFTDKTVLAEIDKDLVPCAPLYEFSKLDELPTLLCKTTVLRDVIAYVVDVRPPVVRANADRAARFIEVYIVDETVYPNAVAITLWEDAFTKCIDLFGDGFKEQFVLCTSGIKPNYFKGRYCFQSSAFTRFDLDVEELAETKELVKLMVDKVNTNGILSTIHPSGIYCNEQAKESKEFENAITINTLDEKSRTCPTDQEPFVSDIIAKVVYVYTENTISYRACKVCFKKVPFDHVVGQPCQSNCKNKEGIFEKCKNKERDIVDRFKVIIDVKDNTGSAKLTMFEERAEEVLGMPLSIAAELRQQNDGIRKLQNRLSTVHGKMFKFRIRITTERMQYIERFGYTVQSIEWIPRLFTPLHSCSAVQPTEGKTIDSSDMSSSFTYSSGSTEDDSEDDYDLDANVAHSKDDNL